MLKVKGAAFLNLNARLINDSEREIYNQFIAGHPKGHILQSFEWGEIKAKTGWKPFYLLIENDGQPLAAITILKRMIPVLKKAIFYAPRGPVADLHNEELLQFIWQEVAKLADKEGAIFLKIDPDVPSSDKIFAEILKKQGFTSAEGKEGFEGVQPKYVFRLDITPDKDTLYANMHAKTRYNVRLAEKKGVTIKSECNKEDLKEFYDILKVTAERDRFLIRSYQYFIDIWDYLVPKGYAKLFMAYYQDKPVAGTLAFIIGDKAWYIYGASANEYRNVMPNYLLQWTMIQWAKDNSCNMYDFRGVPGNLTEDNPLYGLFRFKKGFNGEYTEFIGEFDLVFNNFFYWFWNTAEPIYYTTVRKYIALKKKLRGK